jgi:hypothetical protein
MSQHLSRARISELVIESQEDNEKAHLGACAACSEELAELRSAIATFGDAARNLSGLQVSRELPLRSFVEPKKQWMSASRAGWGLVAACALVLLIWLPIHRKHESQRVALLNAQNDEILMEQIDTQVSRRVPAAMDPLANLILDGTNSTNQATDTQAGSHGNGEKQ